MPDTSDDLRIITTADGSNSILHTGLDETYHSTHGAIAESHHVFIKHGLQFIAEKSNRKEINILEVGFGTGLNAFMTLLENQNLRKDILYTTLEPHPLTRQMWLSLNYPSQLSDVSGNFERLHNSPWSERTTILPGFSLLKLRQTLQTYSWPASHVHLVYFDAFAPMKQPDMWESEIFSSIAAGLEKGGAFVTYAATGNLRRNLQAMGLLVEKLPGAPGKREMTRAVKPG